MPTYGEMIATAALMVSIARLVLDIAKYYDSKYYDSKEDKKK